METVGLQDHNDDIGMHKSLPKRTPIGRDEPEPIDIWRIHWTWKAGNGSGSHVELFETRASFERRLFELALQSDANAFGMSGALEKRRWVDALLTRRKGRESDGSDEDERPNFERCDRILHVENLQDGEWVSCRWGVSAPKLVVERQDD